VNALNLSCTVLVSRTINGYVISIEGRGTMRESHALASFAASCGCSLSCHIAVDLNKCDFLDSTFLGCLVGMHKNQQHCSAGGLQIIADEDHRKLLLKPLQLDQYFEIIQQRPETIGQPVELPASHPGGPGFAVHVMDCHEELAELDGPNQAMFSQITQRLAVELSRQ